MITYEYGNPEADTVLIQPTGEHEMASLENEVREIEKRTSKEFRFIATKVENWNDDLSPWKAPAVFKTEDFCGGASKTLENIIALCADKNRKYYIGGYSLAGLFALWVACQTDIFSGVAAASPSVWFPGFIDYMKTYKMKSQNVYLSLGDREEKTRNPVIAQIGNCIKEEYRCLLENGINCILEWNKGNHFKEADIRTAKAFAWILNNDSSGERTTRLSNL
ncbi:esterase [Ruminococcus sp. AM58-7XD]|jgi:predicted alpha/beta superfamily hydrolase|nr:esterase [Ruminococcus sp. AM58-7XD]RHG57225.1 esterase [Ruminococcus sp. AM22-13]